MKQKKTIISIILFTMFLLLFSSLFLQYNLELNNINEQANIISKQIEEVLNENEKDLDELIASLKEDCIIRAQAAAYILENVSIDETDVNGLKKIAELLQVDELHLFDTEGTLYGGTNPEYFGLNMNDGEQVQFFKPMLTDYTLSLCQDLTPNTAVSKLMMYALVWKKDLTGMVQIGLEPIRLLNEQKKNELSYLFSNMPTQAGHIMCVIDSDSHIILGSTEKEYTGKTSNDIGLDITNIIPGKTLFFSDINDTSYYCTFSEYNDYYIAVMHEDKTGFTCIMPDMILILLFLIAASIIMITSISYFIDKEQQQKKELHSALERAEIASKAKTNFLFNMSHDIRTPMNAILGLAKIAEQNIDNKEKVLGYLNDLRIAGEHLARLINNVLDMSQIENGKLEFNIQPCHLPTTLKTLESVFIMEALKKNINFSIHCNIINEVVFYDKLRIEQIELNLIGNAIKYTPNGGSVTYSLTQLKPAENGYAVYEGIIKDTGIGMSEEFRAHVFELFTREKNSTTSGIQGTGLGLSITKNLIEQMGGSISCNSVSGSGTEFIFRIPLKVGTLEDLPVEAAVSDTTHNIAGKRILLVEDIDINREIIIEFLSEYEIEIEIAEDGVIAVDKITFADENYYHLILMDIQMPNMDGYTATKLIRQMKNPAKANIPIIAMTANAFAKDKQNALAAGMNDHIAKPIDMDQLVSILIKYL